MTDFNVLLLDEIYNKEECHFWFLTRKEVILKHMKRFIDTSQKIIEIGTDTGNIAKYLLGSRSEKPLLF